jgi:hypothetical protein
VGTPRPCHRPSPCVMCRCRQCQPHPPPLVIVAPCCPAPCLHVSLCSLLSPSPPPTPCPPPPTGRCVAYNPGGWWSYEWCHRNVVRQFHRAPDGTVDPTWSMGDFDSQERVTTVAPKDASAGYYHSYHYIDGQVGLHMHRAPPPSHPLPRKAPRSPTPQSSFLHGDVPHARTWLWGGWGIGGRGSWVERGGCGEGRPSAS